MSIISLLKSTLIVLTSFKTYYKYKCLKLAFLDINSFTSLKKKKNTIKLIDFKKWKFQKLNLLIL